MRTWQRAKKIGLLMAMSVFIIFQAGVLSAEEALVNIEVLQSRKSYEPGKAYPLALSLTIKKGIHINSLEPREADLVPTVLKFSQIKGIEFAAPVFPKPVFHKPEFMEKPVLVYNQKVLVMTELKIDPDVKPGIYQVKGSLFFQGCDDQMCFMPRSRDFEIRLSVASLGEQSPLLHSEVFAK
jgi:hypothetical protein